VDVFLERIEDEETLARGDGLVPFASGDKALDEAGQCAEEEQKETFSLQDKPLLKVGRTKNGESSHKVSLVEIEGLADSADALGSRGKVGLWVLETRLEDLFKVKDVHPTGSGRGDVNPGPFGDQTGFGWEANLIEGTAQIPQGTTQVIARPRLGSVSPQQGGQMFAREPLFRLTGQINEERLLFLGQRLAQR
jgi:hypothetical protein